MARRKKIAPKPEKVDLAEIDVTKPLDLVVLSVNDPRARCRLPGTTRQITLRIPETHELTPGWIVTIQPRKTWVYGSHPYVSGEFKSSRLDVSALNLAPLKIHDRGVWDPAEDFHGEPGDLEGWAGPIIERGPRPSMEMDQVVPGLDPDSFEEGPIREAVETLNDGDFMGSWKILMDVVEADVRCLDAHAHLGNLNFQLSPKFSIRNYEAGIRIGELMLGPDFDGVLEWGHIDNRPFLRCLHGYGLCLWRLERFDEALKVLKRMLWLNPSDNQGARMLLDEVRAGRKWSPDEVF